MQYLNYSNAISIRPLRNDPDEICAVADLQCRTYRRQFYDPAGPLKGELGLRFPMLRQYENSECFLTTWKKLAYLTTKLDTEGYAFVAFAKGANDKDVPVGFVKNSQWEAGADLCNNLTSFANVRRMADVAELGSIYVDPDWQGSGIGAFLVAKFAKEARMRGYRQLVTRAYEKNTSPVFFVAKTGAKQLGSCDIPYGYSFDLLNVAGLKRDQMPNSIPGVWLFWTERAASNIAKLSVDAILLSIKRQSRSLVTSKGSALWTCKTFSPN